MCYSLLEYSWCGQHVGKRHTRKLVNKYRPSLVIMVETHCPSSHAVKFWRNLGYDLCVCSEAQGHSGGIWMLVERGSNFTADVVDIFHHVVTISLRKGNKLWFCSAVYASHVPTVRETLWQHLVQLRSTISGPWLLMGDFNEVLLPSEVRGGNFVMSRASKF